MIWQDVRQRYLAKWLVIETLLLGYPRRTGDCRGLEMHCLADTYII